jgi:hypothetical protein
MVGVVLELLELLV